MGETVAGDEKRRAIWYRPYPNEVEDIAVIAEIEQEIMPRSLLVDVYTQWQQENGKEGIEDVYPAVA